MTETGKKYSYYSQNHRRHWTLSTIDLHACSRKHFTVKNIIRNTYICALHWPGEMGPTNEFLDPLKANLSVKEIDEQLRRKKKRPKQRIELIDVKKTKLELHEDSIEKEENNLYNDIHEEIEVVAMANDKSNQTQEC